MRQVCGFGILPGRGLLIFKPDKQQYFSHAFRLQKPFWTSRLPFEIEETMTRIKELKTRHERENKANLLDALKRNGWSLSLAARDLGVGVSTVQKMIEHHGLSEAYVKSGHPGPGNPHREKTRRR
jgi:DNA-binding NtrC family response regulator